MDHAVESRLTVLAELTVRADRRAEFLDYTVENLTVSRAWPGNVVFDILVDEARPETVWFHEVWATEEAQQAYMAWRVERGDLTTLMSMLAGEPRFMRLKRVVAG